MPGLIRDQGIRVLPARTSDQSKNLVAGRYSLLDLRHLRAVEIRLVVSPRAREVVSRELVVQKIEALASRRDDAVSHRRPGGGREGVAQGLELLAVLGGGSFAVGSAQPLQNVLTSGLAQHEGVLGLLGEIGSGTSGGNERERQRQVSRET